MKSHGRSPKSEARSAGILLFRRKANNLEVFLAHPGGPFWSHKDVGAWSIPKGMIEVDEEPLAAARREFEEETGLIPQEPFLPLGSVRQKSGKTVMAWAYEGDADPAKVTSNEMQMEWPRGSGKMMSFPEVDRCEWFDMSTAREKINSAQAEFLHVLEELLARPESTS